MKRSAFALLILVGALTAARADQLLIQAVDSAESDDAARPQRGVTMEAVTERFGDPEQVHATVGEPPITRWEYGGFTVYFEDDRVIHTVARP